MITDDYWTAALTYADRVIARPESYGPMFVVMARCVLAAHEEREARVEIDRKIDDLARRVVDGAEAYEARIREEERYECAVRALAVMEDAADGFTSSDVLDAIEMRPAAPSSEPAPDVTPAAEPCDG